MIENYGHDGYKVAIVASILIFMQSVMIGGRILSRYLQKVSFELDDYVLFVAGVSQ